MKVSNGDPTFPNETTRDWYDRADQLLAALNGRIGRNMPEAVQTQIDTRLNVVKTIMSALDSRDNSGRVLAKVLKNAPTDTEIRRRAVKQHALGDGILAYVLRVEGSPKREILVGHKGSWISIPNVPPHLHG